MRSRRSPSNAIACRCCHCCVLIDDAIYWDLRVRLNGLIVRDRHLKCSTARVNPLIELLDLLVSILRTDEPLYPWIFGVHANEIGDFIQQSEGRLLVNACTKLFSYLSNEQIRSCILDAVTCPDLRASCSAIKSSAIQEANVFILSLDD
jgi:hypothetical protein